MPKKCKNCKGNGVVTPVATLECPFCYNHPTDKKSCMECNRTGWVKRELCETCTICEGTGRVPN